MAYHSELKSFKCDQCKKAFSVKEDLKRHTNGDHLNLRKGKRSK